MILTLKCESDEVAAALGRWTPGNVAGPWWWLAAETPGSGALLVGRSSALLDGDTPVGAACHWVPELAEAGWTPDPAGGWRIDTGEWEPSVAAIPADLVTLNHAEFWTWADVQSDGSGALRLALDGATLVPVDPPHPTRWRTFTRNPAPRTAAT